MASRTSWKTLALVAFACYLWVPSGCQASSADNVAPAPAASPDGTLKDLQRLETLRELFNQEKNTPRLVLLLSPT